MAGHDWSRSNNWKLHQIYQYIFDVIETFSLSYHVNRSKHNYRVNDIKSSPLISGDDFFTDKWIELPLKRHTLR